MSPSIPERVRRLAEEFGPEGHETREVFRTELLRHFNEVERETRDGCRRAAEVRSQAASATGDAAGAKVASELAEFIASGRVEP